MQVFRISALLFLGLAAMSFAGYKASIHFLKTEHDFGKVPQNKPVRCDFEFTNDGDAPLILKDVKASCGCTTPEWPKAPIMPGQKSKITAEYNAKADGAFDKSISVYTNANDDIITLKLKGFVEKRSVLDQDSTGNELKLGK